MPLPNDYIRARHVVRDQRLAEYEVVTWWLPQGPVADASVVGARAICADLDGIVAPIFQTVLTNSCEYVGTSITLHTSGVISPATHIGNLNAGSVTGDALPPQNAAVIRKFSGTPGRAGMGRWFVPLIPELYCEGSVITVAGLAKYQDLAETLGGLQTLNGQPWDPAHRSRLNDTLLPILGTDVKLFVASQDRRSFRPLL